MAVRYPHRSKPTTEKLPSFIKPGFTPVTTMDGSPENRDPAAGYSRPGRLRKASFRKATAG